MKFGKRLTAFLVCCLMMLSLAVSAGAAGGETAEETKSCELRIQYFYEEQPLTGAQFRIYRVGGVDEYGALYLDGAFAEYPVDMTTDDMAVLAEMLYGYAMMDQVEADYQVTIDEYGTAIVGDMKEGIYLVIGLKHSDEVHDYLTEPQLVILPSWNPDGAWSYHAELNPKGSVEVRPVKLKVLKQWDDAGNEDKRPDSIEVNLLRDGVVYDTMKLSAENNWRHTWEELPGGSLWTVVETVPEGYTVITHQEGITYVITNTCDEPPPTTVPSEPSEPSEPEEPDEPELPDTGLLWWPVPVMLVLGLGLVVLGLVDRRSEWDEA